VEVFDRGESFDPRTDTIVRVEARRLRSKLKQYYENDGRNDAIVIELPDKGYSAKFRRRLVRQDGSVRSIVVLPFANLSGDPAKEYLADGLTEEVVGALASLPDVLVVARTSAFQFKGRAEDVRRIARDLGVQTALEGSVRTEAKRIRVAAQLINVFEGFHLWSRMYERELTGVFQIEREITEAIVIALKPRLTASAGSRPRVPPEISPEAHDCYLRGRHFYHRIALADARKSVEYMQRATALAPAYAAAYAGMAEAYIEWASMEADPPWELAQKAREAAPKALELASDSAEAHSAMASVLAVGEWRWPEAEREYRVAIELKPSLAEARLGYAVGCLCPLRRFAEVIAELRAALTFDPLSALLRTLLAQTLVLAGEPDAGIDEARQVLELEPGYGFRSAGACRSPRSQRAVSAGSGRAVAGSGEHR
jgi:serine/threonine-protein kinase